jgi:hypothetical protein
MPCTESPAVKLFQLIRKTYLYVFAVPLLFLALGTISNQAVLYANHDTFPVCVNIVKAEHMAPEAIQLEDGTIMLDDTHCLMTSKTHLNLLADVFDFHSSIFSIGDFMLMLGEWLFSLAPVAWVTLALRKLAHSE